MAIVNFANRSTVGFDEDALTTGTAGEHVLNFGHLTTSGDLANGVFAGANAVLIKNFGSIETSGLGAAGIFVQGENAHVENYGSIITTGDFFGDFEFFSEGIFAEGDRFYIANYGSVHVEGVFSSGLVGVGADGVVANYGHVDSLAFGSTVVAAVGDRSQVINAGEVTIGNDDMGALFVLGEDAAALNLGRIVVTGAGSDGMDGVVADTHVTNKGAIQVTGDDSFGMAGFGDGHQLSNFGLIETHGTFAAGMVTRGDTEGSLGLNFDMLNTGHIVTDGDFAIGVSLGLSRGGLGPATDGQVVNSGVVETNGDGAAGVAMIGDGHHLTNSGRITTDGGAFAFRSDTLDVTLHAAGVVVSGDEALVENTRTGVIKSEDAGSAAVELNIVERAGLPASATSSTLENFGLIKAAAVAVLGGAGQETVINHGSIVGDVDLGDGSDTFVFGHGGTLAGDLFLRGGDDFVRIENGAGTAHIADFAAGAAGGDVIDVSAFFSSFGELQAHSKQQSNDVLITLDHNDKLVLENVQLGALNADDFFLA
jgi:hypothetical protein